MEINEPPTILLGAIPEPEPETRTVLILNGPGTIIMKGPGDLLMLCGSCETPLVVGMSVSQVQNLVFKCNACSSFNETLN